MNVTRENLTFVIAVAGFLLSLFNFIKDCWNSRCHLSVIYKNHTAGISRRNKTSINVHLIFENKSSKRIAVTRMFLVFHNQKYEFLFPENEVWSFTKRSGGEIIKNDTIYTQQLPFDIDGNGALGGYFRVLLPPEAVSDFSKSTVLNLVIYTNRKKLHTSLIADNCGPDSEQYG